MPKTNAFPAPPRTPSNAGADGRHQRSDRTRNKIVQAMFDLLGQGDLSPSAVSIAQRAGVGMRTVFRHFDDMDSIYNTMVDQCLFRVMPKVQAPYKATQWRERLFECIDRRAEIYEMIFPAKVALSLRRFQSGFLMDRYQRDVEMLRSSLSAILPERVTQNETLFAAIEVTLAFSTWRRLRQDQQLSVAKTKQTLATMVSALMALSE